MNIQLSCRVCMLSCLLATSATAGEQSPIVIVHGAWGGAHHWKAVGDMLTADHGRVVRRVSLTGLGERSHLVSKDIGLKTHIEDVVNAIEFDGLRAVVLIAHSYGGVVASGVVEAIPDRIAQVIYIDSHLLENGETYLTHHPQLQAKLAGRANEAGDGWLIPVDWDNPMRDTPHPLRTLTDPIQLSESSPPGVECEHWLLTDGGAADKDSRFRYHRRASERGWMTKIFSWNHNPHRDRPSEVVSELVKALRRQ